MIRMSLLLVSTVLPLLVLLANIFATEQTEKRQFLIKVSVLEMKETGLPKPVEKALAALEIKILEGESKVSCSRSKPLNKMDKKFGFYGSTICIETGKVLESKKGTTTVKTVPLVFKISQSKIIVQDDKKTISQVNSSSMDLENVFAFDKKERFQWGESGNKFVEIMVSEIK